MKNITDLLNEAFDLSYLESSEFPETEFQSVGILGGGTAGYFAALALRKCHPHLKITIIESSKIPVIGVGESTTTEIVPFLHRFLGFDPWEFFAEVQPTLKLGIQFDWGEPGDYKFNFNFFASHHYESYFYENSIENSNWPSVLMNEKKIPVLKSDDNNVMSLLGDVPFSYHIENRKFVSYLRKKIDEQGIAVIDAEVDKVELNDEQFVDGLKTASGEELKYDFYIDCSGFRSKILGQSLKTEFISYETTLATDKALTFNLENRGEIDPFTGAITMNNGWCWKIPMRDSDHYGYVFSSKFCDEDQAWGEIKKKFDAKDFDRGKTIDFRSGRHECAWNKNVFALGNSYAFIEPLESTAIQTIVLSTMLLCRLMPNSSNDTSSITGLNKEIAATWDTFRWFLGVHYKFNNKLDTPFWNWCRDNTDIGDAEEIIALFHERPPLSKGHYGTSSGYTAHEALVFNSYSYDALLFGQKEVPKKLKAPQMSKEDYMRKCESYKSLTRSAIGQRELFYSEELLNNEILPILFDDPEGWIASTSV